MFILRAGLVRHLRIKFKILRSIQGIITCSLSELSLSVLINQSETVQILRNNLISKLKLFYCNSLVLILLCETNTKHVTASENSFIYMFTYARNMLVFFVPPIVILIRLKLPKRVLVPVSMRFLVTSN